MRRIVITFIGLLTLSSAEAEIWGFNPPEFQNLKIVSTSHVDAGTMKSEEIRAEDTSAGKILLGEKVIGVSGSAAEKMIRDHLLVISNAFGRHYDDRIKKDRQHCSPEVARLNDPSPRALVSALADKSLKLICDSKSAKYRAVIAEIYCPNQKTTVEFKYFFPRGGGDQSVQQQLAKLPCNG